MLDTAMCIDGTSDHASSHGTTLFTPALTAAEPSSLVLAAPVVIHYALILSLDQFEEEVLQRRIQVLFRIMCAHVTNSTSARRQYNGKHPERVNWCWELRRVAQRAPQMIDVELVNALAEADQMGLIHVSEKGPLGLLIAIVADYHAWSKDDTPSSTTVPEPAALMQVSSPGEEASRVTATA
jgi:hypothetical protein